MALQQVGLQWVNAGLSRFMSDTGSANTAIEKVNDSVGKTESKFSLLGSVVTGAATAITGAIIGMAGKAVSAIGGVIMSTKDMAGTFQSMTTTLELAGGAFANVADQYGGYSELALKVGGDTRLIGVSATGAADAMTGLLKAGLSLEDVMGDVGGFMEEGAELGGALRASIDLAAASELDMVEASDLAAITLSTFGKEAEEAGMSTDEFINMALNNYVQAADASVASVSSLREAMVNVGPTAASMGFTLKDTNNALAILSTRGIDGARAGTLLKSGFMQIIRDQPKVTGALEANNIQLYDNNGNMRSMVEIIGQLQIATANMSEVEKNRFVSLIAGGPAMNAFNILIEEGVGGFQEMAEATQQATDIQTSAEKQATTYAGAMEAMEGSLETLQIRIGSAFLPVFTTLTNAFTEIVDRVGPTIVTVFESIAESVGNLIQWVTHLLVYDEDLLDYWQLLPEPMKDVGRIIGEIIGIAREFIAVIQDLFAAGGEEEEVQFMRMDPNMITETTTAIDKIVESIKKLREFLFGTAPGDVQFMKLDATAVDPTVGAIDKVLAAFQTLKDWVAQNWPVIRARIILTMREIKDWVDTNWPPIQEKILGVFETIKTWVDSNWPKIQAAILTVWTVLQKTFETVKEIIVNDVWPSMRSAFTEIKSALELLGVKFDGTGGMIETVAKVISALIIGVGGVISIVLKTAAGIIQIFAKAWREMAGNVRRIIDGLKAWIEGAGEIISGVFEGDWEKVKKGFVKSWKGMLKFFKNLGKQIIKAILLPFEIVIKAINKFVEAVIGFFKTLAKKLVGSSIIPDMMKAIQTVIENVLNAIADFIERILDAITKTIEKSAAAIIKVWTTFVDTLQELWETVWEAITDFIEKLKLKEKIDALISAIQTSWETFVAILQSAWETMWTAIQTAVETAKSNVGMALDSFVSFITEAWNTFISGIQTAWETLWANLVNAVNSAWEGIIGAIQTGLDTIVEWFESNAAINKLRSIGQAIVDGIKAGLEAAWGTITGAFSAGMDLLKKAFMVAGALWSKVRAVASQLLSALAAGISSAWSTLTTKLDTLLSNLIVVGGTIWRTIVDNGKTFVDAIKKGIEEKWSAFIAWLRDIIIGLIEKLLLRTEPDSIILNSQRGIGGGISGTPVAGATNNVNNSRSVVVQINPTYAEVQSEAGIFYDVQAALAGAQL